jgi:monoamine oxidase
MSTRLRPLPGRTPLFGALARAMRLAAATTRAGAPPPDEIVDIARHSRRRVLGLAAAASLAALSPRQVFAQGASPASVAVVGAGIAGLNAAWRLMRAGVAVTLFEASRRTGGRMFSREGVVAPGLVTELGAELINSDHRDMLALVRFFELPLIDLHTAETGPAIEDRFHAGGAARTEEQIVAALRPFMRRILADRHEATHDPQRFAALDRLSLAQYVERRGIGGWLRAFILRAFTSEMGGDADAQTALYFIQTLLVEPTLDLFQSDERYSVRGGNQRVPDALADALGERIKREHVLESVRMAGARVRLSFDGPSNAAVEQDFDAAIIAIPATLLRRVDLPIELPAAQRRGIRELAYGSNAKLFAGLRTRVFQGSLISDLAFEQAWDSHRNRSGEAGALTLFAGGREGRAMARATADSWAGYRPLLAQAIPALAGDVFTGQWARFHWPTYPWALGSYACFRPGQMSAFRAVLGRPSGPVFFAGEHVSEDFQGYMEGGAQTGRLAAEAVLARLGVRAGAG